MREVWFAAAKDLRRYSRDPLALLLWVGVPLLIGSLLIIALGGSSGPAPQVHLLVADEDDNFISRLLVQGLAQTDANSAIRAERVERAEGEKRLEQGDASALVILPDGFVSAVLRNEPLELQLVTNPSQRILPGIAEQLLGLLREAVFYAHRLVGPELGQIVNQIDDPQADFSNDDVSQIGAAIEQRIRKLEGILSPRLLELEMAEVQPAVQKPATPFAFYFLPGMLLMGLLFTGQGIGEDLWSERDQGILRRVVISPRGVMWFLIGKTLAMSTVASLVAGCALAAGMRYFELPFTRWPLALLWASGIGVLFYVLMLLVQMQATTRRGASVLSLALVFPLMMLGGSMFPLSSMPAWLAALGRWTPIGWGNEQLSAILLGETGPLPLPIALALLAAAIAVCLVLAGIQLTRSFARS